MVGGLSTVAGSVLVGYSLLGARLDYLIAASFMAAPGALLMAKFVMPKSDPDAPDEVGSVNDPRPQSEDHPRRTRTPLGADMEAEAAPDEDTGDLTADRGYRNVIDAAAGGAADGLRLAATIGAMLLAFISLIALINLILGEAGGLIGLEDLTFERILGISSLRSCSSSVCRGGGGPRCGELRRPEGRRQRVRRLLELRAGHRELQRRRRGEIAQLGIRAILAATLANLMSAAITGILIG